MIISRVYPIAHMSFCKIEGFSILALIILNADPAFSVNQTMVDAITGWDRTYQQDVPEERPLYVGQCHYQMSHRLKLSYIGKEYGVPIPRLHGEPIHLFAKQMN